MLRALLRGGAILLLVLAGWQGWRLLRAELAGEVYRERLSVLSEDYRSLRERYDAAVRRTAVSELVVEDGTLSVRVRTADGELRRVATELDPSQEIYVDFVVLDGRLWIRRVFDAGTPPARAVVIDPGLAEVDWDAPGAAHGKAAYRRLGEGRWVVTVTGDGSLGLAQADPLEPFELSPPPPVRDFQPVEEEVGDVLREISPLEALRALAQAVGAPTMTETTP